MDSGGSFTAREAFEVASKTATKRAPI